MSDNNSKNKQKYVYIVSLGCAKNFVDTEVIVASLVKNSIGITEDPKNADVYLINTCAFIPPAREESESFIKEAVLWKNKKPAHRKIVICGCLIQKDIDGSVKNSYPSVDLWLGIDEAANDGDHIAKLFEAQPQQTSVFSKKPSFLYDDMTPRMLLTLPHYAYIKIADGCSNMCSYCSIPSIRGTLRSRDRKSIIKEARSLINNGVKEIILIAQDTTAFGMDKKKSGELEALLSEIDGIEGDFWVRLMYAHPKGITDKLLSTWAAAKHVLHYVDLPLQHISDNILKSMKRKVSTAQVKETLSSIRSAIPDVAIRTTFLVGYPGETNQNFEELCSFIAEQKFERLGAFQYYPEENTPAALLKGSVDADIAEKRVKKVMTMQAKISLKRNLSLAGHVFDVIVDQVDGKIAWGRTYMDAPDIDNTVSFNCKGKIEAGTFVKVRITSCSDFDMHGEIVKK